MSEKGGAFLKGGMGCLFGLTLLIVAAVLMGRRLHFDLGGAILLFLVGGLIGLAAWAMYDRGQKDASRGE